MTTRRRLLISKNAWISVTTTWSASTIAKRYVCLLSLALCPLQSFLPRPASVDDNGVNVSWVNVKPILVLIPLDRHHFSSMLVRIITHRQTRLPLSLPPSLPPSLLFSHPPSTHKTVRTRAGHREATRADGVRTRRGGRGAWRWGWALALRERG